MMPSWCDQSAGLQALLWAAPNKVGLSGAEGLLPLSDHQAQVAPVFPHQPRNRPAGRDAFRPAPAVAAEEAGAWLPGVQVEARHREALHSAITLGVRRSLAGNLSREQVLQEALRCARVSVPDAVRALVKDDGILRALAEAKLRKLLDTAGRTPPALR